VTIALDHTTTAKTGIRLLELEITHRCQLTCTHCLTTSSPQAGRGTMTLADWKSVIDQAGRLGIPMIQLIGGEPLTSPFLVPLLGYAVGSGRKVEVYSNLYKVPDAIWGHLSHPAVSLATSYYSDLATEHDTVTHVAGSHERTRANIIKALELGISVRAGIVEILDGQRTSQARAELEALGVTNIKVDRMRAVGRAATGPGDPDVAELCGRCGLGRAAVLADGTLSPCVLGRFLKVGNVKASPLGGLLTGPAWQAALRLIPRDGSGPSCDPDGSDCSPASTIACSPAFD
jgi:MoaA/NifB/PqqE/SkfB family radical SAM enzyme